MKFLYQVTTRINDALDIRRFNVVAESGPIALRKTCDHLKSDPIKGDEVVDEIKRIEVIDIE